MIEILGIFFFSLYNTIHQYRTRTRMIFIQQKLKLHPIQLHEETETTQRKDQYPEGHSTVAKPLYTRQLWGYLASDPAALQLQRDLQSVGLLARMPSRKISN